MQGGEPHGPYWYGYYREGKRLRSVYIGKTLPKGRSRRATAEPTVGNVDDRWSFRGRTPSLLEAQKILGVMGPLTVSKAKKLWRKLVVRHHPDKARNEADALKRTEIMKAVNAAWAVVMRYL